MVGLERVRAGNFEPSVLGSIDALRSDQKLISKLLQRSTENTRHSTGRRTHHFKHFVAEYELNMFIISKTLRDYYKDPESIAHKVLADRMTERDPGNKPASNERIPYAYIKVEEKDGVKLLQGDKIEHVNYIQENSLELLRLHQSPFFQES